MKKIFTKENIKWFLLLNAGLILIAVGIHFFKSPNNFALGGTSGLSIIAKGFFPSRNIGVFMYIINGSLLLLGLFFLGKQIMGATLYSSIMLSTYVSLLELIYPMNEAFTSDTLLELCYAVALPAVGSAILFNINASSGGTDIVAMILSKKTSLEIGKALLVSDFSIAFTAGFMFGVNTGLYCILGLIAKAFVVDGVIDNIKIRKQVTIISKKSDDIRDFIIKTLKRSSTMYEAVGAYTNEKETVVITVLSRRQTVLLRRYIKSIDPKAFITIVNSSETIGKGFRTI
ncbi:MAG: YitT family protein [Clostridia bacterium]